MRNVLFCLVAIPCLLATCPATGVTAQQSVVDLRLDSNAPSQWLMLRNGSVFSGKISESGGRYTIQIDPRTQMAYDPSRVWVIADSLSEISEFYRARVRPGDLNGQAEFARWCVAQRLWDEAASEIDALKKAEYAGPQLRGLILAWERARHESMAGDSGTERIANRDSVATSGGVIPATAISSVELPARATTGTAVPKPARPLVQQPPIVQPSATVPRYSSESLPPPSVGPTSSPRFNPANVATSDNPPPIVNSVFSFYNQPGFENDHRVQAAIDGSVQQPAVDQFNETVHWAVVQACAGCHYPENEKLTQASKFALEIPSAKHKATLTQTRHNLEQILPLINRENPGNSRMLELLSQPHGSLKESPLSADSDDYRVITQWIFNSGIVNSGQEVETKVLPAVGEVPADQPALKSGDQADIKVPKLIPGSLGPEIDPRRPYDPEPFNRLYHPDGPPLPSLSNPGRGPNPEMGTTTSSLPPTPMNTTSSPRFTLPSLSPSAETIVPEMQPHGSHLMGPQAVDSLPVGSGHGRPPTAQTATPEKPLLAPSRIAPPSGIPRFRREAPLPASSQPTDLIPR